MNTPVTAETFGAMKNIKWYKDELDSIPASKEVTVTTRHVEKRSSGGFAGFPGPGRSFSGTGRLPGFGGGDRVHVLAEDGEHFTNKYSAREHHELLNAINLRPKAVTQWLDSLEDVPRFQAGGWVGDINLPRFKEGGWIQNINLPALSSAGTSGASNRGGSGETMTIDFKLLSGGPPVPGRFDAGDAQRLVKGLKKAQRGR